MSRMTGKSGWLARNARNSAAPSSPEVVSALKFMSAMTRSTRSLRQRGETLLGVRCGQRSDVVQAEQQRQCLGDCRVVIDDEYGAHGGMLAGAARNHTTFTRAHALRVANAGGMDAAPAPARAPPPARESSRRLRR